MSLVDLDIGNTRIKWRLRQGGGDIQRGTLQRSLAGVGDLPWDWASIRQFNVACVAKPDIYQELLRAFSVRSQAPFYQAQTTDTFMGLRNAYANPGQLGIDRWLAMVAVWIQGASDFIVVDCGSAVTIDLVTVNGVHEGGYIIPGLNLQLTALRQGTHLVKPESQDFARLEPGRDTTSCAENGVYSLLVGGVESILRRARERRPYQVYFTGGDAELLKRDISLNAIYAPELVLDGLAAVAQSSVS